MLAACGWLLLDALKHYKNEVSAEKIWLVVSRNKSAGKL